MILSSLYCRHPLRSHTMTLSLPGPIISAQSQFKVSYTVLNTSYLCTSHSLLSKNFSAPQTSNPLTLTIRYSAFFQLYPTWVSWPTVTIATSHAQLPFPSLAPSYQSGNSPAVAKSNFPPTSGLHPSSWSGWIKALNHAHRLFIITNLRWPLEVPSISLVTHSQAFHYFTFSSSLHTLPSLSTSNQPLHLGTGAQPLSPTPGHSHSNHPSPATAVFPLPGSIAISKQTSFTSHLKK